MSVEFVNDEPPWPIRLFRRSVMKQRKYREIVALLGDTNGLSCLDIGSDNGVISYLLRQRGGQWSSADLDETTVRSIRELVGSDVHRIDGVRTPFRDHAFDRVVIVDFLEHIETDWAFVGELQRILKPGGELIINVPHAKDSWLRRFRLAIGQTDERHGHVRHGYTKPGLLAMLRGRFEVTSVHTYSKFFSECVDTLVRAVMDRLKKNEAPSVKGTVFVGEDLRRFRTLFRVYSALYPVMWCMAALDALLWWRSGYMVIAKAVVKKESGSDPLF